MAQAEVDAPDQGDEARAILLGFALHARRFLDLAMLSTPIGRGRAAGIQCLESDCELLTARLTLRWAQTVDDAIAGLSAYCPSLKQWLADDLLVQALPGYIGFSRAFAVVVRRWGFVPAKIPVAGRALDVPRLVFPKDADFPDFPLPITRAELALMERGLRIVERVAFQGVRLGVGQTWVVTTRGTLQAETPPRDRFWADPSAGKVGFVGGAPLDTTETPMSWWHP